MLARVLAVVLLLAGSSGSAASAQTSAPPLVGTWDLVKLEQGASAQSLAEIQFPIGILIQDAKGNVIEIVTTKGRSIARTSDEQIAQFLGFMSFWGSFTADAGKSSATYRIKGDVDPGRSGTDVVRSYARKGNELTLTEPASAGRPMTRTTWRKIAELEGLPAYQDPAIGFWKWETAGMVALNGVMVVPTPKRDESAIVYTPTGHMAVLYLPPAGRKKFAGARPTAEEARAAMQGLVTYFGTYIVQPKSSSVTHYQLAIPSPAAVGSSLERNFSVTKGTELRLTFPPQDLKGQQVQNTIQLSRLGGLADMSPGFRR